MGRCLVFISEMSAGIASLQLPTPSVPWSAGDDHVHVLPCKEQCLILICLRGKVF